jgi:hypothetical protein
MQRPRVRRQLERIVKEPRVAGSARQDAVRLLEVSPVIMAFEDRSERSVNFGKEKGKGGKELSFFATDAL